MLSPGSTAGACLIVIGPPNQNRSLGQDVDEPVLLPYGAALMRATRHKLAFLVAVSLSAAQPVSRRRSSPLPRRDSGRRGTMGSLRSTAPAAPKIDRSSSCRP